MKKILLLAALALGMSANAAVNVDRAKTVKHAAEALSKVKPVKMASSISVKEDINIDYSNVQATKAEVWYYGDIYGEGYASYFVTLSTTDFSSGLVPLETGRLARIMVNGPVLDDPTNVTVPVGEYELTGKNGIGTIDDYYSEFLDAYYDEAGDISGYLWTVKSGKLVISKNDDGTYSVSFAGTGQIYVSSDEIYNANNIKVTFNGAINTVNKWEDPSSYNPLEGTEYKMTIPNASGRYSDGDYSLALYGCKLDEDGFVVGSGDLFNTELIVNASNPVIAGTYSCYDLKGMMEGSNTTTYAPGDFLGGYWYPLTSSYYLPIGTNLQVMDEDGYLDKLGLAKSGTIKIECLDNGNYTIDVDFMTFENTHVTGTWTGDLKSAILDFPEFNGINDVTVASGEAVYYNLQGVRVAQPEQGVYIKVVDGKATKVAF